MVLQPASANAAIVARMRDSFFMTSLLFKLVSLTQITLMTQITADYFLFRDPPIFNPTCFLEPNNLCKFAQSA
jgi:hypothetical protein